LRVTLRALGRLLLQCRKSPHSGVTKDVFNASKATRAPENDAQFHNPYL
jgi:hypothetical protein